MCVYKRRAMSSWSAMAVSGGSFVWLLSLPYDLSVEKGADVSRNKANAWERGYSRCGEIDDHDVGMDTAVVSMPDARGLGRQHKLGHVVAQPVGVGWAVAHDEDMNWV